MARPIGSKNKPKFEAPVITKEEELPPFEPVIPKSEVHYDAIFGVRCHRTGIWKGQNLWELTKLDNSMKRTILIDATDRKSIMNMVIRYIGKIVVPA